MKFSAFLTSVFCFWLATSAFAGHASAAETLADEISFRNLAGLSARAGDEAELRAALARGVKVVVVDSPVRIVGPLVVPTDGKLSFTERGALYLEPAALVTIAGALTAPDNRIFYGPGRIVFSGTRSHVHSLQWWGAVPNDDRDDTLGIQQAIDSLGPGKKLSGEHGTYIVTATLTFRNKTGIHLDFGTGGDGLANSGVIFEWRGPAGRPIAVGDYFKNSRLTGVTFKGADTGRHFPSAGFLFTKDLYRSNSGVIFSECVFRNCAVGLAHGDETYDNDFQSSEHRIVNCTFDNCRIGMYIAGTPGASQHVNIQLYWCTFKAGQIGEYGVFAAGGHFNIRESNFGAAQSTKPYTAIYLKGDTSLTQPILIEGCYAEKISRFLATEDTEIPTQWFRTAVVTLSHCWIRTNKDQTVAFNRAVEIHKNLSLLIVNSTILGKILYAPPLSAPDDCKLTVIGRNQGIEEQVALDRAGKLIILDRLLP